MDLFWLCFYVLGELRLRIAFVIILLIRCLSSHSFVAFTL
jgi:hypothetical protein